MELRTCDVVILGGGPGGMSAAISCVDLGLDVVLIEQNKALGGQLLWTYNLIKNYLGSNGNEAAELAKRFEKQVLTADIEVLTGVQIVSADLAGKRIVTSGGSTIVAKSIVIATGIRRRKLGIPGEEEFDGRGVLVSGVRDAGSVSGKRVVIVGGGDAALENAVTLSDHAGKILVVHRRTELTARPDFVSAARERSNVEFLLGTTVQAIGGHDHVENVTTQRGENIQCDAVLLRIGVVPNTELFFGQIDLDEGGNIIVDRDLSAMPGVWAVGDVTGPFAMTIANAVGQGSLAAKRLVTRRW